MCVQFFHMVSIDVPAGVGAPQLDTTSVVLHMFLWYEVGCCPSLVVGITSNMASLNSPPPVLTPYSSCLHTTLAILLS